MGYNDSFDDTVNRVNRAIVKAGIVNQAVAEAQARERAQSQQPTSPNAANFDMFGGGSSEPFGWAEVVEGIGGWLFFMAFRGFFLSSQSDSQLRIPFWESFHPITWGWFAWLVTVVAIIWIIASVRSALDR